MRRFLCVLVTSLVALPVLAATADAAYNSHLTRAPYLTDLIGNHVIVNFATDQTGPVASVSYGAVTGTTCALTGTVNAARVTVKVGNVNEYQWKAPLDLADEGQYCYRILLGTTDLLGTGASPVFTTQAKAGAATPFSFAVFGDWGYVDSSGKNIDQQNMLGQLALSGARFAVTTGDNGYPSGSQLNYGDLQQSGARSTAPICGRCRANRSRSSRRPATTASAAPPTPT
jgi:hypothetical protein